MFRSHIAARSVLVAFAALATARGVDSPPVVVDSFPELQLAVDSAGTSAIEITAPQIVFARHLNVRQAGTALLIKSTIGATLSGAHQNRIFVVQNGSKLSLRGVRLECGMASEDSEEAPHGGAIFLSAGSEVHLHSVQMFDNHADYGGAIYAISSSVTAVNCTISSNLATSFGGAIAAAGTSTVTATGCTMVLNSAASGGGVFYAVGDSTVATTNCTITSNFALRGGSVYSGDHATIVATDCEMTSNSAGWGGAFNAVDISIVSAIGCTMKSNSAASGGGWLHADHLAAVAASDCTMTSNSASTGGGAAYMYEGSTLTATNCTMASNSAAWGGAIKSAGNSIVIAIGCTMTSNSAASGGGVLHSDKHSAVATTDCTMTSNAAAWGGAVYLADQSTIVATKCEMSSNAADWGGAAAVRGGVMTVANCLLTLNSGSFGGGAVVVDKGGTVDLVNSVLQSNSGATGSTDDGDDGIVNLNGQVQCDAIIGCLPVCTDCQDEEVMPSLPRTPPPVHESMPTASRHRETGGSASSHAIVALSLLCLLASSVIAVRWRFKFFAHQARDEEVNDGVEINQLLRVPITDTNSLECPQSIAAVDIDIDTEVDKVTRATTSPSEEEQSHIGNRVPLPWSAIRSSPGLIFAINREMRVVSWSLGAYGSGRCGTMGFTCVRLFVGTGMSVSVPLISDPRDLPLEALPFVHARTGEQCRSTIRQVFDATAEQENVPIMLHFNTKKGPKLLQMVANVVRVEREALVVLTGREVDSGLAGLLHRAGSVRESDHDTEGQFDRHGSETDVSSITLPSLFRDSDDRDSSEIDDVSSIILPSLLPSLPRGDDGRTRVVDSVEAAAARARRANHSAPFRLGGTTAAAAEAEAEAEAVGELAMLERTSGAAAEGLGVQHEAASSTPDSTAQEESGCGR